VGERADVILEWHDDDGRHEKRIRDVELTTGEHGLTDPIEHDGRTFHASHTYIERHRDREHTWAVFSERKPPG
jgi:hypothetical protein